MLIGGVGTGGRVFRLLGGAVRAALASAAARDEGGTWVVIQPLRVNIPVTPGKMEFFHWIGPRVANLSPLFVAP